MSNPFAGTWTYRSFHNNPDKVDSFDEIALAQAVLDLTEAGPDWLSGRLVFGKDYLEMTGVSTLVDGRWQLRMRAVGPQGSTISGWIYDYVGTLAADWRDGDRQVPAIVGTVTRTVFHRPARQAGQTYSFVAVSRAPKVVPPKPLPSIVVTHFADREHRLHHAVWHGLRNGWTGVAEAKRALIAKLGWAPPRVARIGNEKGIIKPFILNGSGEDFLYFHRDMIAMFRNLMRDANGEIVTWATIPEPGADGDDNVPPGWEGAGRRVLALKTDEYYWSRMRWWDQQFKDPTYLATLTLGQLGSLLEFTVHNDMHMRWSAPPRDPTTNELAEREDDVSPHWDDPRNDWLGDFYSSHVNPFFWRLHGWVDDRINDWFEAHEAFHPGEIVKKQVGGWTWFEPGKWVQLEVEDVWVWPEHLAGGAGGHGGHGGSGHGNAGHAGHGAGGGHGDGHGGGHGGGHTSDPALRDKRIRSLEAVLDVLAGRALKPEALAEAPQTVAQPGPQAPHPNVRMMFRIGQ